MHPSCCDINPVAGGVCPLLPSFFVLGKRDGQGAAEEQMRREAAVRVRGVVCVAVCRQVTLVLLTSEGRVGRKGTGRTGRRSR